MNLIGKAYKKILTEDFEHDGFYVYHGTKSDSLNGLGEAGLDHLKPKLALNDKMTMIKRVDNGESINEVALSYGRKVGLLSKWIKIYRQYGMDGLKSLKQGRKKKMKKPSKDKNKTELEQLREENEYLRAENEYLKKLRALIQEEEKDQPPGKK